MSGPPGAVLVTGATGTVGRHLVAALLAAGQPVHAAVLDPASDAVPAGALPVRLDFTDPSTAAPAFQGVDRLFLMRPPAISDVRSALGPTVEAAVAAGVRQVVVLSVLGVNPALPHWRMERMVTQAGLHSTALRPAYFAQNLLTAFGEDIRRRSQLRLAAGNGRLSFIDTRDVAAVAARLLSDPVPAPGEAAGGPVAPAGITLTGPAALSFVDAARLLSDELGRTVSYVPQGLLERWREVRAGGADATYARVQLVIDLTTRMGLAATVNGEVERLLGRPATPLSVFIADHRAAWLTPQG